MDYKQTIIEALDTLRRRDVADKQVFKAKAYEKVIKQLRDHAGPITTAEDLKTFTGIGEKIQAKIAEIMATGQLASAARAKETHNLEALETFQKIYGVGPAKATELVAAGFRSVADLRANPASLNDKQRVGLAYYEDLLERIPREEMLLHEQRLTASCPYPIEVVGSYRRGAASSGDIDALIRLPEGTSTSVGPKKAALHFEAYVESLKPYIIEILAQGPKKCMAICKIGPGSKARRLDLLLTPANEYAYALLYFTGSDKFNVAFRAHALQEGYTLNEHTMKAVDGTKPELAQAQTSMEKEEDIFAFLKLKYIPPTERVGPEQIIPYRLGESVSLSTAEIPKPIRIVRLPKPKSD
jgi:DNA polymerase/3'-5' exonuclease PolX